MAIFLRRAKKKPRQLKIIFSYMRVKTYREWAETKMPVAIDGGSERVHATLLNTVEPETNYTLNITRYYIM